MGRTASNNLLWTEHCKIYSNKVFTSNVCLSRTQPSSFLFHSSTCVAKPKTGQPVRGKHPKVFHGHTKGGFTIPDSLLFTQIG